MSVYKKLQDARIRLQNMDLKKSGHNKFARYFYFELGDFLPQVQQIFSDIGLFGAVSFSTDVATLRIVDIGDEKEIVFTSPMGSAALKGCHEVQNIGAVELYQRRYLWVAALEIVEHDALDAAPTQEPQEGRQKPPAKSSGLTDDDMDTVGFAMEEAGDFEALKTIFGPAFKKATKQQQAALQKQYEGIKSKNKWS